MREVTNLRNGTIFEADNFGKEPFIVLRYEHIKMARGGAVVKLKIRGFKTGVVKEVSFKSNDKVKESDVLKKNMQFLYADNASCFVMDKTSFEQVSVPFEGIDSKNLKFLKGGEDMIVTFYNDSPIDIEFPKTVTLKVEYTEPGFKGDTATTVQKPATLETGAEIYVPLFIKVGDTIKVKVESGEYGGKA
ncbi:MAG: elongation factor P [Patescibacteria group bacterium]|nr:elongation factor P [Patescibacteria group bacterium]